MRFRLAACVILAGAVRVLGGPAAGPGAAGDGKLYVGGFPGTIYVLDEAREAVAARIELRSGIPYRMRVSHDRRRFYIMNSNMEDMEVVDVAAARSIDTFRLSDGERRVRVMRSFEAGAIGGCILAEDTADHRELFVYPVLPTRECLERCGAAFF